MMICAVAIAQERLPGTSYAKVRMIVTVEPRQGKQVPVLAQEDVTVFQDRDRLEVTGWAPCQRDNAGVELFIVIDDASDTSLGTQNIRDFINSQPPSVAIGVGYIRNGIADTVENLTKDHAHAAASLRVPMGSSIGTNPYSSLSELIRHWTSGTACREILMVTPGVSAFDLGSEDFHNVFVDTAIADAQREGVVVYAIYALGTRHSGHSLWFNFWAQNSLAPLAEEPGGEAYSLEFGAPFSLAPYLSDLASRFAHQYLLAFAAKPGGNGGFQPVKVTTEVANADLVSAPRCYVRAEP